jgi:nucleotide-binding universal stress UspA family protein
MIQFKRILVPLDGSALSESALPLALGLAQKFESHILLLRVVDMPHEVTLSSPVDWRIQAGQQARQVAESYLKVRKDGLEREGFDVRILVHDVSPADSIIETAQNLAVDVIVMATHGRGGVARWAVGSVADKVMRHGPCPVLLVRQKPDPRVENPGV